MDKQHNRRSFQSPQLRVEDLSRALYEANLELTRVNGQLQESKTRQRELLANLSHDLRSPVATIRNYAEYLLSFPMLDEAETTAALEAIQAKALLLENAINQMLALTTLDEADDHPHLEALPVAELLEEFFHACACDPKYRDCRFSLELAPDFSYQADMDVDLIYRVLENLVANAVKFSEPPREIVLRATGAEDAVTIAVEDNGIGIPPEQREKVFERTYKVSHARTPDTLAGCGLGLSIAKTIVEKHGGRIWCEGAPENGSVFSFTLPAKQAAQTTGGEPISIP